MRKLSISDNAVPICNSIVPFWDKLSLSIRHEHHILNIKDLPDKKVGLMRNQRRNNEKQENKRVKICMCHLL